MIVELLTLGDELLDGRRIDTNTAWLGRRLTALGIPPRFRQSTTDRVEDIRDAFERALARSDVVISTGGLGPTADDLTIEALALAIRRDLEFHPGIYEGIQKKFESRGLRCPESNRRQALLPRGAVEIVNDWGTAPACRVDVGVKIVFCLPGVPIEMQNLFDRGVVLEIERRLLKSSRRREIIYKFVGLGESFIEESIDQLKLREIKDSDIRVAYTASFPQVDVTLSICAPTDAAIEVAVGRVDRAVRAELGSYLVAKNEEKLESRVVEELRKRKWTIAVAESMTGGLLSGKLVDAFGSSKVFLEGHVTYSNEAKIKTLGVSPEILRTHGAVSPECALEMARGAQRISGATVALSTTGIAGPEGGSHEKPIGLTYLAWVGPKPYEEVRRYQFSFDRNRNRIMAVYESLKGLLHQIEREPYNS